MGFEAPKLRQAREVVEEVLRRHDLTVPEYPRVFWAPGEWRERGELYGLNSVLVVTHDGGDHAPWFSWDYGYYGLIEEMRRALEACGLFAEQCTSWYSAIYEI